MLTERLQIQALADRLAGLTVRVKPRYLIEPWRTCWRALENAPEGQVQEALVQALAGFPDRNTIIEKIMTARPGYQPTILSLAELAKELEPIEWVWEGWIVRGMLTVLGASQGSGKSFMATDLSWRIIHNQAYPDGQPIVRPGANVIYVDGENVPQVLNERAENYGIDRSKLFVMLPEEGEGMDLCLPRYQDRLAEMVAVLEPELVILDSLSSIHTKGQNNVEDLRDLFGFLVRLARYGQCGLLLIHHIRKPAGGIPQSMMSFNLGMEDLSGSGYITQQARVVLGLHVVQTTPDPDPNGPRSLKVLKTNLGPYPQPMGFRFVSLHPNGIGLQWDLNAPAPYREPTQKDECKEWLEDFLRSSAKPVKPLDVIQAAKEEGISRAMVFRARKELGSKIVNVGGRRSPENRWKWVEEGSSQECEDSEEENLRLEQEINSIKSLKNLTLLEESQGGCHLKQ
ncbi:MAG: AAA family ATPase [Anaerolineales bacterium]|nr:AAA family ATPase [Anaerolineales bacterium]